MAGHGGAAAPRRRRRAAASARDPRRLTGSGRTRVRVRRRGALMRRRLLRLLRLLALLLLLRMLRVLRTLLQQLLRLCEERGASLLLLRARRVLPPSALGDGRSGLPCSPWWPAAARSSSALRLGRRRRPVARGSAQHAAPAHLLLRPCVLAASRLPLGHRGARRNGGARSHGGGAAPKRRGAARRHGWPPSPACRGTTRGLAACCTEG
mmetsp:Transcript_39133/g.112521  ORF Transcript_39133/g.112521 Transcript_39133/m.112521 type:complete len:209 (+) Transcript_39133:1508-2134(+)